MPLAASCSPIHAELVSTIWPSSSSVPTATTSQRIGSTSRRAVADGAATGVDSSMAASRAATGTAQPLTTASTTAAHRNPFHSHVGVERGERQQREADRELLARTS